MIYALSVRVHAPKVLAWSTTDKLSKQYSGAVTHVRTVLHVMIEHAKFSQEQHWTAQLARLVLQRGLGR